MSESQALLVAAIDFGTTYSGYAFSFRHDFERDPTKVIASSWTAGSRSNVSLKTSSCILFDSKGKFDSFGFEAEEKYSDLTLDDVHHSWYFFRRFKMMLYNSKDVHRSTKIRDETGKEMPAIDVFSTAIRYLKEHLLETSERRICGGGFDLRDIRWVLTVPAIWDDQAKQFMREAAEKAGIPDNRLMLALEPEAASMFCKYLPVERMTGSMDKKITCFQPGSKYLVLDAGGGTVDITVHEVQRDETLKELCKANGGNWGGTTIDQAFLEFITEIVGEDVIVEFQNNYTEDYMEMMREFEIKKRNVQPSSDSKMTLRVPITLYEIVREKKGKEIREVVSSSEKFDGKVSFAGDKMRVDAEVMKHLFKSTTDAIVKHIKNLLKEPMAMGVSSILMVGGFSESTMLRDAVQQSFPNFRVIVPNEAGLAVLKGAVIYGHNSNVITSRIAKYTYGFKKYANFDPKIHPPDRKILKDGEEQVRGSFCKLVEIGQPVSVGEESMRTSCCPQKGHAGFALKLFASPDRNPLFVDDPGCISLGEVTVNCLDKLGRVGSANVWLIFGGTELEARAELVSSKEQTSAKFDFLE